MSKRPRIQGAMEAVCMFAVTFMDATRCLIRVRRALSPLPPLFLDYPTLAVLHWLTCAPLRLSAILRSDM